MRLGAILALSAALPGWAGAQGLTKAQGNSLMAQIAKCWNTGRLSAVAHAQVVTVHFSLDETARPLRDSFALIGAGKGTWQTTKDAYSAAKRAILRCGARGFKLPLEKHEEWKDIEITFNPERMPDQ